MKMKAESMKEESEKWEKETFRQRDEDADGYARVMREGDKLTRKEHKAEMSREWKSVVREVEPFKIEIEKEAPLEEKKEVKLTEEEEKEADDEKEEIEKEQEEEKKEAKMTEEEKKEKAESCEAGCASGM